jgi:hypothetical protein
MIRSFLVLFFKKELLPFAQLTATKEIRKWQAKN